jgi:hypothetical protein
MKTVRPGVEEKDGYDEHGSKSCDWNVVAFASDQLNPPGSRARVATTFETSTSMQPDWFSFSTSETGGSGGNVAIAQRIVESKVFECSAGGALTRMGLRNRGRPVSLSRSPR